MAAIPASGENRRHFRIRYPLSLRPRIVIGGRSVAVIDVSEGGIRFVRQPGIPCRTGIPVSGAIHLRCGDTAPVHGSVVRATSEDVALSFARGVSFNTILREQRVLHQRMRYSV